MPRGERQPLLLRVAADIDLAAVGQLADDVVQHVCRHSYGAGLLHVGRDALDHLALQVGRLELERRVAHPQQYVGKNGNGGAPFDDAGHVTERPQQFTTFDH
jgi:hypothetical protein